MRRIDIERLLSWAYRSELPKSGASRLHPPSNWSSTAQALALGTRIDTSGAGSRYAAEIGGAPHADALAIAAEVGSLSKAIEVDIEQSGKALLGDLAMLAGSTPMAPPTLNERTLVIDCADAGCRPAWRFGNPQPRPLLGRNGKPVLIGQRFASARYSIGAVCPLSWEGPTIEQIALGRARYAVWHAALIKVAARLKGKLKEHDATGPSAPAQPWNSSILPEAAAA